MTKPTNGLNRTRNIISIVIGVCALVGIAAGIVLGWDDISENTSVNTKQQEAIDTGIAERVYLGFQIEVHETEFQQMQKNIEVMQTQVTEGIKVGNERYIEIIKLLPKD